MEDIMFFNLNHGAQKRIKSAIMIGYVLIIILPSRAIRFKTITNHLFKFLPVLHLFAKVDARLQLAPYTCCVITQKRIKSARLALKGV